MGVNLRHVLVAPLADVIFFIRYILKAIVCSFNTLLLVGIDDALAEQDMIWTDMDEVS